MGDPKRTGTFDLRTNPELEDLFKSQQRKIGLVIRTTTIAKIVATDSQPLGFDSQNQLVSVEVQQPRVLKDIEDPSKVIIKDPITIKNIPVYFPKSSKGFVTFPLSIGDTGELVIQDRDPGKWYQSGTVTDPVNRMIHNLAHGVFHPGLSPESSRIQNFDITATVLDGETLIKIGKDAIQPAVLGDDLLSKINELISVFNSHKHIVTGTTPPGGGALVGGLATPTTDTQSPAIPTDFQSQKVSIE